MKAAVLGAGYMGSAITFPLSQVGIEVNLWGTWLDHEIISACREGKHPKLNKKLPGSVVIYSSEELDQAINNVQLVFIAVTSQGFIPVLSRVKQITGLYDFSWFCLTKGLVNQEGKIQRLSSAAAKLLFDSREGRVSWVSVGGPVKAMELAYFTPTLSIYGTRTEGLKTIISNIRTPYYITETTSDICGLEICSAFKNIYALGLGICDGLYQQQKPDAYHNLSSLLFGQAIKEMALLVMASGGKEYTAYGPAGVGDLYVTAQSGRNRKFGEFIGQGLRADKAYQRMMDKGEEAEGYHALKSGISYVKDLGVKDRLPFLGSLYNIVYELQDPEKEIIRLTGKL